MLLKLARLTATDLQDCMQYLQWAGDRNETIEADVLRQAVDRELGAGPGPEKRERLEALRAVLP